MKSVTHWKPHYVASKMKLMLDHKRRPNDPWLTRQSVDLLAQLLKPTDIALEFGSGRSTRWFARHVARITSIEHDATWHKMGLERLAQEGLNNVDLLLHPLDVPEPEGANAAYVRVLDGIADDSIDVCLVDGMYRGYCALGAFPKIRAGGMLVVDNAGWFFPSTSKTPGARPMGSGGYDSAWDAFIEKTRDWRRVWTTDGVTDTVIFFKR